MKKKDVINKIRMTALNEMPDILNRIDLDKINIEAKPEKVKFGFNFRRALSYSLSAFLVVISAFLFYNFVYTPNTPDMTPLNEESEIIGFQTVSAASMLDASVINPLAYVEPFDNNLITLSEATTTLPSATTTSDMDVENQMDLINNYLNMMETVLGDEDKLVYQSFQSDKPEYAYAIEFKSMDLSGNLIQYHIYYNRQLVQNEYQIEGIMVNNDFSFNFSGTMDKEYYRTKTEFRAYVDEMNYVEVKNVSTNSNQVFNYKIVRDDKLYNESTVSIQSLKYSLQATVKTMNNNEDMTLTITRGLDNNNNQQLSVQYILKNNITEKYGLFQVGLQKDENTGKFVYAYRFNSDNDNITTRPRNNKGNKPATDDDFKRNSTSNNANDQSTSGNDTNGSNGNTTSGKGAFGPGTSLIFPDYENDSL